MKAGAIPRRHAALQIPPAAQAALLVLGLAGLAIVPVMLGAIFMVHWGRWSFSPTETHPMGGMEFQVVLLLIALFSTYLGWLPSSGYRSLADGFVPWISHLVLPAITVGVVTGAGSESSGSVDSR